MHEKAFNERADLSGVIDYAIRDWDDYIEQCHEEEISPIDSFEDFVADSVIAAGYHKQSEVERLQNDLAISRKETKRYLKRKEETKTEVAREIFAEIEKLFFKNGVFIHIPSYNDLKKKYTEVCTDCRYFVGCECFDGKTCDLYTEGGGEG